MNKLKNILNKKYPGGFLLLLLVLILGTWSTIFVGNYIKQDEKQNLLSQVTLVGTLLETYPLDELTLYQQDTEHPSYKKIKTVLEHIRDKNPDYRFVYILRLDPKTGKQVFLVDAEPETSKDFSPPGQVYEDALFDDIENHMQKKTYTKGPYIDSWGRWFSAYAPILNDSGHNDMIGIDIDAKKVLLRITIVQQAVMFIFGLIFLATLLLVLLANKK